MKLLAERSTSELDAARHHLDAIIAQVARDKKRAPGTGWEPILDMLRRDRDEIKHELRRRVEA